MVLLNAEDALNLLVSAPRQSLLTSLIPRETGLYILFDHEGKKRYIGETFNDSFRQRIGNRHVSGSEDVSHKFACNYSVGRIWHDKRNPAANKADGAIARRVRQSFVRRYCGYVCLPINGISQSDLRLLQDQVISIADPDWTAWNNTRKRAAIFQEPRELIDKVVLDLGLGFNGNAALERQEVIYKALTLKHGVCL